MEEKLRIKEARRLSNRASWALLVYYYILNILVTMAVFVDAIAYVVTQLFKLPPEQWHRMDMDEMAVTLTEKLQVNFWGYILAIALGIVILLAWKGKDYWCQEIWAKNRPMTVSAFFSLLCLVIAAQGVIQVLAPLQEWFFNLFGLSAMAALETATTTGNSLSMFLYACFIGPLAEELLFRGLILRSLKPAGKQFAIFFSAVLFGLYHGNVIQIPYAMAVGLLFAYVTVEYSIGWAVVLHIFNNFVLADLMSRLTEPLPIEVANLIFSGLVWGAVFAAIVICVHHREKIRQYMRENFMEGEIVWGFITSPGFLVFTLLMLGSATAMLFV